MIKKRHLNIFSLVLIGFVLGWTSNTLGPWHRPDHREDLSPKERFQKLGLEQKELSVIEKLHKKSGDRDKELNTDLLQHERIFNKLIEISKNEVKLRNSFKDFIKKRNKLEEMRFESMLSIHRHLTLEQIKKLRSFGPPGPKYKRR